jgi:hypothetical protein
VMRRFVVLRESVSVAREAVRCVVEVIAFFVGRYGWWLRLLEDVRLAMS